MNSIDYENYMKSSKTNPFGTGFSADQKTAMPDFGAQIGFGRKLQFNNGDKLDVLISGNIDNSQSVVNDAFIRDINVYGSTQSYFNYDSYTTELKTAGLASLGYTFGHSANHSISYTGFYSRNVEDNFKYREGTDEEGNDIYGSNSVMRIYSLFTNQLSGNHQLGDKWEMDWVASISKTNSDEPDRRQALFYDGPNGSYIPFALDAQSTSRYFASLNEDEYVADLSAKYKFNESGNLTFGAAYRNKERDYGSSLYTYGYSSLSGGTFRPELESVFDTDGYINQENINNGNILPSVLSPLSSTYYADSNVAAGFVDVDYTFGKMLVNLGMRVEYANQNVKSWEEGENLEEGATISEIDDFDLFPALNLKYNLNPESSLRLAMSKSVTRPSFIEMLHSDTKNHTEQQRLSVTVISRMDTTTTLIFVTTSSPRVALICYRSVVTTVPRQPHRACSEGLGGSTEYTFLNSRAATAGLEVELRKEFMEHFRFGINASYILTQVVLDQGAGIYTDSERQLQGASPYLVNADLSYALRPRDDKQLTMTLLYSLQGPRIDAVGVNGRNNAIQKEIQELNLVCSYSLNSKLSLSLKVENLLNYPIVVTEEDNRGRTIEVGRHKTGIDASVGVSYKF